MKAEILQANLALTLRDMKIQTGKEPGGPTKLCYKIPLGALTGEPVDFQETKDRIEQRYRKSNVVLDSDPVILLGSTTESEALTELLANDKYSFEAVLVAGRIFEGKGHLVAVVPTGESVYQVVDSLRPNALEKFTDAKIAVENVISKFRPAFISLHVVPTAEERASRRKDGNGPRVSKPIEIGKGMPSQEWQGTLTGDFRRVIFSRPHKTTQPSY